jgi:hypothetical protein
VNKWLHQWLAGCRIPYARSHVFASREGNFAVWTEGHTTNEILMVQGLAQRITGSHIPESGVPIESTREELRAIRAKRGGNDRPIVPE